MKIILNQPTWLKMARNGDLCKKQFTPMQKGYMFRQKTFNQIDYTPFIYIRPGPPLKPPGPPRCISFPLIPLKDWKRIVSPTMK